MWTFHDIPGEDDERRERLLDAAESAREPFVTIREPGMTAEQADRIAELAEARGMTYTDLAHASALAYGEPWWLALSREDADDLIRVLETAR